MILKGKSLPLSSRRALDGRNDILERDLGESDALVGPVCCFNVLTSTPGFRSSPLEPPFILLANLVFQWILYWCHFSSPMTAESETALFPALDGPQRMRS
jgi:hypothetical protein